MMQYIDRFGEYMLHKALHFILFLFFIRSNPMPTFSFSMSAEQMIAKARSVKSALERDLTELAPYGVTMQEITAFNTQIDDADALPNDDILQWYWTEAIAARDAKAAEIRTLLGGMVARVENKYGVRTSLIKVMRCNDLARKNAEALKETCQNSIVVLTERLAELASEGLTQAMIDSIGVLRDELLVLMDDVTEKVRVRTEGTVTRTDALNALYLKLVGYCKYGKLVWEKVNESKYADYVIYDEGNVPQTPPAAVENLMIVNSIVSWFPSPTATSYRVAISLEPSQSVWEQIYSGESTQVPVPLPQTGGIFVRVQAYNDAGLSDPSFTQKVISLATPSNLSYGSGELSWSLVDWANGYYVEESSNGSDWTEIWNQNTNSMPLTLQSGTWYYRVRAGFGGVYSGYSDVLEIDGNQVGG